MVYMNLSRAPPLHFCCVPGTPPCFTPLLYRSTTIYCPKNVKPKKEKRIKFSSFGFPLVFLNPHLIILLETSSSLTNLELLKNFSSTIWITIATAQHLVTRILSGPHRQRKKGPLSSRILSCPHRQRRKELSSSKMVSCLRHRQQRGRVSSHCHVQRDLLLRWHLAAQTNDYVTLQVGLEGIRTTGVATAKAATTARTIKRIADAELQKNAEVKHDEKV
ncbi:hypothetical protein DL96DRAFT_316784 [Flagelloscypha sp. PMI_526]|nr:hypothetical protein DL96DRAFT_316784 [Flagelloscypha sp. PMI_526]